MFYFQIYYFMGATSLNCLLLRKNLCHWAKGMQIRYNLSHIEDWARENKLDVSANNSCLLPVSCKGEFEKIPVLSLSTLFN
jgi:myosin-5